MKNSIVKKIEPYLYLLPVFVLFGMFVFYPLVRTVVMSVSSVNTMGEIVKFAGIKNFQRLFLSQEFWRNLKTTFTFAVILVPFQLFIGLLMALLADNRKRKSGTIRVIFALPMSISYACGSMIWMLMFNANTGIINYLLGRQISWTGSRGSAMVMILVTTCWLTAGMNFIYTLSGRSEERRVGKEC